jgi:hypothetical protein
VLIAGIVLVVIAGGAAFFAVRQRRDVGTMDSTHTTPCGDVTGGAVPAGGRCEVAGTAAAGPGGLLTAPLTGQPCVWYRTTTVMRYWEYEWRGTGEDRTKQRVQKTETVADDVSEQPFAVVDTTGSALVAPAQADIVDPTVAAQRFDHESATVAGGTVERVLGHLAQLGAQGGVDGYERTERVLAEGTPLFVMGEFAAGTIGKGGGRFVISTRSEEQLTTSARRTAALATVGSAVAAVAGIAFVVIGAT